MTPITESEIASFRRDGYVVLRGVLAGEREGLERSIAHAYALQALKIPAVRDRLPVTDPLLLGEVSSLDLVLAELEAIDKEAAYQALPLIAASAGGRQFAASPIVSEVSAQLLDCPLELLFVAPPSPFINQPDSKRLLYRWHAEAHYYPKRRRFVNLWAPLFRPKNQSNGTMWFASGSHLLEDLPFVEYQGYDDETFGKRNHFVQYEIPEQFVAACEKVAVEAQPGDLVAFDRRMVHASSQNPSTTTSYAVVCRAWDPRGDLTLSGHLAATPYGGDYGRPGLEPII